MSKYENQVNIESASKKIISMFVRIFSKTNLYHEKLKINIILLERKLY